MKCEIIQDLILHIVRVFAVKKRRFLLKHISKNVQHVGKK